MRYFFFLLMTFGLSTVSVNAQEHSVFFESNAYHLSETQKATLDSLFSTDQTITNLTIIGFCDDIGSKQSNQILSQKRANNVASFLQNELHLVVSNSIGKGEISLPEDTKNADEARKKSRIVKISFSKEFANVQTNSLKIELPKKNYKTFSDELKKGDHIIVNNLVFKGSVTDFLSPEEADLELLKIIAYLNAHPTTKIEIQGHVCCITNSFNDAYDRKSLKNNLSETRAKKVYDYFVEKGIATNRMTHKGYGRKFPIPGADEGENKRVEIVILED